MISSSSPSFPQHRMDLMLCWCRMWAPPTSLCLGTCQLIVMASIILQWCSGRCRAPYCDQLKHHRPPPLHFVHVHVCLLCNCVQHAQITVCMVHVYDLCSVHYLLDRSSSHACRHCTPVGTWCWASSVLQPACPGTLCTLQSLTCSLCSIFLCFYPSLLLPFFLSCLTYSLTSSLP